MAEVVVKRTGGALGRTRARWGARGREAVGLGGLLVVCCVPAFERRLDVLSFSDGGAWVEAQRLDTGDRTLSFPLDTVDLDDDGAQEVLVATAEGLLWIRGDGPPRSLWSGHDIVAAQWVEPTPRHEGRILMLVRPAAARMMLVQLACSAGRDPVCMQASSLELDPGTAAIAAADLDEDDVMDVLTWGSDRIDAWRGTVTGDGSLAWPTRERFGDSSTDRRGLHRLATADLDADGHADVVASQASGPATLLVYFGNGAGGWDQRVEVELPGCSVERVAIALVDDDAQPDIVTDCRTPTVLVNRGARALEAVALTDDDTVEADEVLLGRFGGAGLSWFLWSHEERAARLIQPAEGSTWTTRSIAAPLDDAVWVHGVVADFDGDGIDEIVVVTASTAGGCVLDG